METKSTIEEILIIPTINAMIYGDLSKETFPELNRAVAASINLLQERKMKQLIGKKYIPQDNSYIREIINGKKMNYHCNLIGVLCQIISLPYITEVDTFVKGVKKRMIKVQSLKTGLIYEVLFAESWICD